jgi:sugar transferase (PEP-CTERM/EpsH1 system associated)
MRIFVLLSRIPWPLEKGDKLRAFHQIKCLSQSNEIILCALNTDKSADKQKAFRALQPYCKSVNFIDLSKTSIVLNLLKAWVSGKPLQTGYFYSLRAQKRINQLIKHHQPNIIYGQLLRVAEYIREHKLPKVLDYQDVFSMGMHRRMLLAPFFLKPFFRMEYKRLANYEAAAFDEFELKTIISLPDRDLIQHPKKEEILVIPNGVDHDFFKPMHMEKKFDVVFTGNMAYPPNVNAAAFLSEVIMPRVWQYNPNAKLLIAGATPDRSVVNLANHRVHVSGWMDDIRLAYAGSKVFVAPMQMGTGLQNKLLEAMSMQLPCVTTPLANDSLKAVNKKHILVGETAAELSEAIIKLLSDSSFSAFIAQNGHDFVNDNYNWESATAKLEKEMIKKLES